MTTKRIVHEDNEGKQGVHVIVPSPRFIKHLMSLGMSEDEAVLTVLDKDCPSEHKALATVINVTDQPGREFRDAWEQDLSPSPEAIKVSMPKASNIHMDRIRHMRDKELVKLDAKVLRAMESGDTVAQASIVAQKQTLRDIPQDFKLQGAANPQALSNLWPTGLPRYSSN